MSISKWLLPTSWKRMELAGLAGASTGRLLTPQPKVALPVGSMVAPSHLLHPEHRMLATQWVELAEEERTLAVVPL